MKQIEPINIWINGQNMVGQFFQVTGIFDNYQDTATNNWQIFTSVTVDNIDQPGELISGGNLTITGQDYIDWGNVPASSVNTWIYNWSATQLGLTIIP
jgi:hemolysin activation/secretion protein